VAAPDYGISVTVKKSTNARATAAEHCHDPPIGNRLSFAPARSARALQNSLCSERSQKAWAKADVTLRDSATATPTAAGAIAFLTNALNPPWPLPANTVIDPTCCVARFEVQLHVRTWILPELARYLDAPPWARHDLANEVEAEDRGCAPPEFVARWKGLENALWSDSEMPMP